MYENTSAEFGWTALRATRWDPPSAAKATADRMRTYVFALEQAEQMFAASRNVGQATRPVLVYYGLNQAGRAVAAAAAGRNDDMWRLSGHGIHAKTSRFMLTILAALEALSDCLRSWTLPCGLAL